MIRVYFRTGRNSLKSKLYKNALSVTITDGALYVRETIAGAPHSEENSIAVFAPGEWMRVDAEEIEEEKKSGRRPVGSTGLSLPATPAVPTKE